MCKPLSFYAAEIDFDIKIWWSQKTDHHTKICKEHGLKDDGRFPLYAGEFYPDEARPSADLATWQLRWDSDATNGSRDKPTKELEAKFRVEIEAIAKQFVTTSPDDAIDVVRRGWAFGTGVINTVIDGSAQAYDNAVVRIVEDGYVGAVGNSRIETIEGGHVLLAQTAVIENVRGGYTISLENATIQNVFRGTVVGFGETQIHNVFAGYVSTHEEARVHQVSGGRVELRGTAKPPQVLGGSVSQLVGGTVA